MCHHTFVSTALAFYMRGAKIVFADVRSDTFNIDEKSIEKLITKKTKAICTSSLFRCFSKHGQNNENSK